MSKGRRDTDPSCGRPWSEHSIDNVRGSLSWRCPGDGGLLSCVCGDPRRPGSHGAEVCQPERVTGERVGAG